MGCNLVERNRKQMHLMLLRIDFWKVVGTIYLGGARADEFEAVLWVVSL